MTSVSIKSSTHEPWLQTAEEKLRWLSLLLPLVGVLWAAVPADEFRILVELMVAVTAAVLSGCLVDSIPRVPPLLGMMLAGATLKHLNVINLPSTLAAYLRSTALAITLLRAGLELDLTAMQKLSTACIRLTFLPCFAEAFSVCVVSHFILGLPYLWGLLLGFVLAAVSPAVVVPAMIDLTHKGLGMGKGIPTLLLAASSFDDVAAITGFGVVLGMIFSGGSSWALTLASGPLEAIVGLVAGALLGAILVFIFPANRKGDDHFDLACSLHLVYQGIMAIFISNRLHFGGLGPLTAITSSAAAVILWKRQAETSDADSIAQIRTCHTVFASLWLIFEPILFSLIGMEIQLDRLESATVTGGLLTLAICLTIRIMVTYFAVSKTPLNIKERLFVCVGWLPKATVQAALAPTALDMVRRWKKQGKPLEDSAQHNSEIVLTVGVIAILVTAPIGAVAISALAPILLTKEDPEHADETDAAKSLTEGEDAAENP